MSIKKKFYWYMSGWDLNGPFDTAKAAKESASSLVEADDPDQIYVFELVSEGRIPPEPARVWVDV